VAFDPVFVDAPYLAVLAVEPLYFFESDRLDLAERIGFHCFEI